MDRLKINDGGQPIYLDDLSLLQGNDAESLRSLLVAMGGGGAYLLSALDADIVSTDSTALTTTARLKAGTLVVDGELLPWEDTVVTLKSWNDPVYLIVREEESDSRLHEDGQARTCRRRRWVEASLDATGAAESYMAYDLPTLGEKVRDLIGYKVNGWKSVNASFFNGYGGTVKYQDLAECYRVWVNIKSASTTEIKGGLNLFWTDAAFLQYFNSGVKAWTQTENGILSFTLTAFEGTVAADVSLPYDDATCALAVPVNLIFEIPK